jgi:hypothetical protein
MSEILVTEVDGRFDVSLADGASVTVHEVSVPAEQLARLGLTDCEPRLVVEESMRFLLEREPKEAIVKTFDLDTIASNFPEYPGEIRKRMSGAFD